MFDTLTHGELLKKTAMEVEADIAGIHKQIEEISGEMSGECFKAIENTK